MKLQSKIVLIVTLATSLSGVLFFFFFSKSMEKRDVDFAINIADREAELIKEGLLSTMINTGDYQIIEDFIIGVENNQFKDFRMVRAPHVIKQHGIRRNELPKDDLEREALKTGRKKTIVDSKTNIRFILPFVTDQRCGKCHLDMNDQPVKSGVVNGLAVISVDLSPMLEKSRRVRSEILFLLLGAFAFTGLMIFALIRRSVVIPMGYITTALYEIRNENFEIDIPPFFTEEIEIVAESVRLAGKELAERKRLRENELAEEKSRLVKVNLLLAGSLKNGKSDEYDKPKSLMMRLYAVLGEAERASLVKQGLQYVEQSKSWFILPSDPSVIAPVSVLLTSLIEGVNARDNRNSIELSLEEGLANAILHGNLEIDSPTSEMEFDEIENIVKNRRLISPYKERFVRVDFNFDKQRAVFKISDMGDGFDWRSKLSIDQENNDLPGGRGIKIIETLASSFEYNRKGNELIVRFDLKETEKQNPVNNRG